MKTGKEEGGGGKQQAEGRRTRLEERLETQLRLLSRVSSLRAGAGCSRSSRGPGCRVRHLMPLTCLCGSLLSEKTPGEVLERH